MMCELLYNYGTSNSCIMVLQCMGYMYILFMYVHVLPRVKPEQVHVHTAQGSMHCKNHDTADLY